MKPEAALRRFYRTVGSGRPTRHQLPISNDVRELTGSSFHSGPASGSTPGLRGDHLRCVREHRKHTPRSEEHTSELQSLMRISYAVFCLKKQTTRNSTTN